MCYKTKIQEISKEETNYKFIDTNMDINIILKNTTFSKLHNKSLTKKEKDLTSYIPKSSNF